MPPSETEYTPAQCMAPDGLPPATPGTCRGCGAAILWGKTTTGKGAPFDAEPPHVNHFVTCPQRESFRKKAKA